MEAISVRISERSLGNISKEETRRIHWKISAEISRQHIPGTISDVIPERTSEENTVKIKREFLEKFIFCRNPERTEKPLQ